MGQSGSPRMLLAEGHLLNLLNLLKQPAGLILLRMKVTKKMAPLRLEMRI